MIEKADPGDAEADGSLVERCRAGDAGAFEEIVRRHRRTVYAVARRVLGSHEDADEAAQQAFLRAWRGLSGFRGDAALGTWLVRIVLNVSKSMRATRGAAPEGAEQLERLRDPGEDGEQRLRRRRLCSRVRRAVAALPTRQRQVVLLKVFSDMTHSEVAEAMELSEGAVKAHLHQAVSNLRRSMAAHRGDEETRG